MLCLKKQKLMACLQTFQIWELIMLRRTLNNTNKKGESFVSNLVNQNSPYTSSSLRKNLLPIVECLLAMLLLWPDVLQHRLPVDNDL